MTPPVEHGPLPRWTAVVSVAVPVWFAAAEATRRPWALNPDGISYLDQAAAWRLGDLGTAINSYWSPVYPILLAIWGAATSRLDLPTIPGAHALNVLIALGFAWSAARLHRHLDAHLERSRVGHRRRWVVWAALLASVTLVVVRLAPPSLLTPDLLMATMLLVVATSAMRLLDAPPAMAWPWVRLGLLTGLLYLTKTAGLPVGLVLVACTTIAATGATLRSVFWRGSWAALGCAVLVLPWAAALSRADGRITLGSSATLNRTWSWNEGVSDAVRANRGFEVRAVPREAPGTHPRWYAPQRFIGKSAPSDAAGLRRAGTVVRENFLKPVVVRWHLIMLGCATVAALAWGQGLPRRVRELVAVLLLPPIAGMGMYLLVHVEGRFYTGFIVLALLAGWLAAVAAQGRHGRWLTASMIAIVLFGARPLMHAQLVPQSGPFPNPYQPVVDDLRQAGVAPGASVAVVGEPFDAYWALPAQVRIAATLAMPASLQYLTSPPAARAAWEAAFRAAGAEVVVLTHGHYQATVLPLPATVGP